MKKASQYQAEYRAVNAIYKQLLESQEDGGNNDFAYNTDSSDSGGSYASTSSKSSDNSLGSFFTDSLVHEISKRQVHDRCSMSTTIKNRSDNDKFKKSLAVWSTENQIRRKPLDDLLTILHSRFPEIDLPKSAKTLLQTPKQHEFVPIQLCGGQYGYFGLEKGIRRQLNLLSEIDFEQIDLLVNIDGLPLYKSAEVHIWPILASFQSTSPFIVCLFCGNSKPTSVDLFLTHFLEECQQLTTAGIEFKGQMLKFNLEAIIADCPARQFLKCIKGHNGYNACERCTIYGIRVEHNMCYIGTEHAKRNDSCFSSMKYHTNDQETTHQYRQSPLISYKFGCISKFPLDYLHLCLLGVVKRLIKYWESGPYRPCRIGSFNFQRLSYLLSSLQGTFPNEFARQPRELLQWKRYKAVEFKSFLLYSGIVQLKHILASAYYDHFMLLSISFRIFLLPDSSERTPYLTQFANQLLIRFVEDSPRLYSKKFMSLNVHSLIHLYDDVNTFKCSLQKLSSFPFENFLQVIKHLVRSSHNHIAQVFNRLTELDHCGGELMRKTIYTKAVAFGKNSWFLLENCKTYIQVVKILSSKTFSCKKFEKQNASDVFVKPCCSSLLNIVKFEEVQLRNATLCTVDRSKLSRKCVHMQYNTSVILIPLISKVNWKT